MREVFTRKPPRVASRRFAALAAQLGRVRSELCGARQKASVDGLTQVYNRASRTPRPRGGSRAPAWRAAWSLALGCRPLREDQRRPRASLRGRSAASRRGLLAPQRASPSRGCGPGGRTRRGPGFPGRSEWGSRRSFSGRRRKPGSCAPTVRSTTRSRLAGTRHTWPSCPRLSSESICPVCGPRGHRSS